MELIDLDTCVINALELFIKEPVPKLNLKGYRRPLVVGSGNAAVTGQILFENSDAVFADESTFKTKLNAIPAIDAGILISASGGKHAPIIAKELKKRNKKVILITNNENALAKKFADETHVFPKNPEPYTYNTSTYMGMILAASKENPKSILAHIKKIDKKIPKDFVNYDAYFMIIPNKFAAFKEMLQTKFDELFGARITGRFFTPEQAKHAKTIVPYSNEMFISFGEKNKTWGKKRINMPLPKNAGYATLMATAYYVIGKIQKQNPPYFKENIQAYTKKISKIFKQNIKPIVE